MTAISLGPFDLVSPLGRGGLAEVWRGIHRDLGVEAAIKVVAGSDHRQGIALDTLRDEVRAVAELDHPHVIWVYDQGVVGPEAAAASNGGLVAGSQWFAMELAEGGPLRRELASFEALRAVLLPLLEALAHAHARGLVHRDVKPANVLFGGIRPGLKLCDFGLTYALGTPEDEIPRGTPAYMAPEQCLAQVRRQGPWTDLYAVGCVAFALASGRHPFLGDSWASVFSGHVHEPLPTLEPRFAVPEGFHDWIRTLLQKDPRDRFRFAADARHTLLQLGRPTTVGADLPPWRGQEDPGFGSELRAAGLGLFGLRAVPVIGHEPARDTLWQLLRQVTDDGRPTAVVVRGASGSGKSRLTEWFGRRAHELGAATVFRAVHSADAGPDQGVPGMLLATTRCEHLDRSGVEAHLAAQLAAKGVEDPEEARLLARLIRPVAEDAERPPIEAVERRGLVVRAMARHLESRPGVVLMDDAQWGPEALRLARAVLSDPNAPPLVFVLAWGDEGEHRELERGLLAELEAHEQCRSVELTSLPTEQLRALLRAVLRLEPELEARVCEISGGHAGLAIQVVADWVERDLLVPSEHGHRLRAGHADLPANLADLLRSRIDAVVTDHGDAWRYPLELAATLGSVIDGEEWRAVCRIRRVEPDRDLVAALRAAGLTRPVVGSEGSWAFRHGLLREVLLADAGRQGRLESHHLACARMLEGSSGPGIRARLGNHRLAGVDFQGALEPLLDGAEEAFLVGDYGLAARWLAQREDAMTILALPASDRSWGAGWMLWTRLRRSQGRFEEAQNWLVKVLGTARLHGWTRLEIQARIQAAKSTANPANRAPHARRALELATELGDPVWLAEARYQEAIETANLGDNQRAAELLRQVVGELEAVGRPARAQGALVDLAHVWLQDARWQDVNWALNQADALPHTTRYMRSQIEMLRGEVARYEGRYPDAEAHYLEAHRLNKAIGNVGALLARIHVGITRAEQGRFTEAAADLRTCLRASERPLYQLAAHLGLLLCTARPGDSDWDTHLDAVGEWARGGRADADVAGMLEKAGLMALEAGHLQRARDAMEWAAQQYEAIGRTEDAQNARLRVPA